MLLMHFAGFVLLQWLRVQRLRTGDGHSELPKCGSRVIPSSRLVSSEATLLGSGFDPPGKWSGMASWIMGTFVWKSWIFCQSHVDIPSITKPNRCQRRPLGVSQGLHPRSAEPAVRLPVWCPTSSNDFCRFQKKKIGLTKNGDVNLSNCNGQK